MSDETATVLEENQEFYQKILRSNRIKGAIKEMKVSIPELAGENLASKCKHITIEFEDEDSDPIELFVKRRVEGTGFTIAMFDDMMVFEKESSFFNSFLPDAKKFCESRMGNDSLLHCFPKCYYADSKCIILENLISRNYEMLDKTNLQTFEQAKIVLQNMAKFHAVACAMIQDMGIETFSKKYPMPARESYLYEKKAEVMQPMYAMNLKTCVSILEAFAEDGKKEHIDWLRSKIDGIFLRMCKAVQNQPNEVFLGLTHGDCWNNNMMFLRDPVTHKIYDHMFVDMQVTRVGSPNLDISFYLFTSVQSQVRKEHFETLLKEYYHTFDQTTQALKAWTGKRFTFEIFLKDFKKKCEFGFTFGLTMKTAIGAMKHMDPGQDVSDLEKFETYFNQVMTKWIDKNPDKASDIAKECTIAINEYRQLTGE